MMTEIRKQGRNVLRRVLYGMGLPRLFGSLRGRLIGPFATAVLAETENGTLLVPVRDAFVGRALCFRGSYDPAILRCLLAQCGRDSQVLVVGAHVGAFAIPVARKVRTVTAVEANPKTHQLLALNAMLNGLRNLEIHNFAAGDRTEDVSFVVTSTNTGGSRVRMEKADRPPNFTESPQTLTVPMRRLDDVFPGSDFDLIVMDIEGAEAMALRGMQNLLARCRALVVEIVEEHLRRIAKLDNEQFLSLISPYFDEAVILPEGRSQELPSHPKAYPRSAFGELMAACCNRDVVANVLFRRSSSSLPFAASCDGTPVWKPDVVVSNV